ncbi:hypothetical protein [Herbiconiux liukaitaii]
MSEEPDILPDAAAAADEPAEGEAVSDNPLFRTPQPGEHLTADELEDRAN